MLTSGRHIAARLALTAALLALPASLRAQGTRVYVRHAPPGEAGALLRDVLAHPYELRYERWNTRLFRDSVVDRTVLVIGSSATVASTVHGDVVVVGGDLFLQPGAHIDGRAIAYGGGVYDSQQASVGGGRFAFRDVRIDAVRTPEGTALDYRPAPPPEGPQRVTFPLLYGLRIPAYRRVDGVSLPWGPRITLGEEAVVLDPTVTYRSDLGAWDPALAAHVALGESWSLDAFGGRTTLTNDRWIQSEVTNSLTVLAAGRDYRNYWRADRIEGRLTREWSADVGQIALWGGARTERDWSVAAGGPWSIWGQSARNGMRRANPAIERGRLSTAIAGVNGSLALANVMLNAAVTVERPFDAPRDERFTQTTADLLVAFPTFSTQSFTLRSHAVLTAGDTALPQRFSYLGGAGTLPTFDVLQFGGDRLVFIESMYNVPLGFVHAPVLGAPVFSLRHAIGAAGVGKLPAFEQNLGARLSLGAAYVEYAIDPATRHDAVVAGLNVPGVR
ncbi:MAG: hypothetical protein IRY91_16260 [Gemmatimonadaceae bacterium]|nr:hypothetical protein [Gemmatimonadaceae bacterium]